VTRQRRALLLALRDAPTVAVTMPMYSDPPAYLGACPLALSVTPLLRWSDADASQGFVRGLFGLVLWELILTSWFEVPLRS
jgi:hypothetical protein